MTRKSDNYVGKVPNASTVYAAVSDTGNNTPTIRYQKKNVQYASSQPYSNPEACSGNMKAKGGVPITVSSDDQIVEHQSNLLCRSAIFHNPTKQRGKHFAMGRECGKMDLKVSPSGQIKLEHDPLSKLWMRQELKNSELPKLDRPCLSVGMLAQPESGSWTSNNITEEQPASKCQPTISSSLNMVMNVGKTVENIKALPGVLEENCKNAAASKLLISGDKAQTFCGPQNDICWAVNEAHGAQLAAEAIEMDTGCPVAEFEKLLHSASPVICPSVNIHTCQTCIRAQGAPLCRHEIPNISLGNLWQWYEKPANYGLEVKAEEQYGIGRLKFCAYFVPFLSAIQLFKYIDLADSRVNKISGSQPVVDLPTILSILLPRPHVEKSSSSQKRNVVSASRSFSDCSVTDLHHPPVESNRLSDHNVELLFEYFEYEQPQNRKPLFEKIQDLVTSSCGVFGDPSVLQSARLPDLHPHSWFAVAWYPIYRIPRGDFRAAFLTYHSLGHYVHSGHGCLVSPIVGLQSYNAQGECWFQPRQYSTDHLKEVNLHSDPPSVLRDRLKTLEQTASLMSRAVRTNGAETLVNWHSDYEFFLSRRC
ncbi:hypothetical protein HAX54_022672 [Datura stramonium]|uniref:Uncharacterized protein n=1 Tax=Datura stramonium TaxID=4076 RepID=A0ABS8S471_DATST|nr:hypothetical protein [Datura stramonium]